MDINQPRYYQEEAQLCLPFMLTRHQQLWQIGHQQIYIFAHIWQHLRDLTDPCHENASLCSHWCAYIEVLVVAELVLQHHHYYSRQHVLD